MTKQVDTEKYLEFVECVTSNESLNYAALLSRLNNLELDRAIADSQNKKLNYELVDFHSSRPGHDLRYALSGEKMKKLGWKPRIKIKERINQVVKWSLNNPKWIEL